MITIFSSSQKRHRGAALVEYALALSLIAVLTIGATRSIGSATVTSLNNTSSAIARTQARNARPQGRRPRGGVADQPAATNASSFN